MDRRTFLKTTIGTAVFSSSIFTTVTNATNLFNSYSKSTVSVPDLVAVKGAEPDIMFDKGIDFYGGLKYFIKKGQKVVVKPNIGWDTPPERAANTNPKLVGHIVKRCLEAGAKEVYVFDNTCDNWEKCYRNSGIESAVKSAGGKMVPANSKGYYQDYELKNTVKLKSTQIHELIFDADVVINVPVLKSHGSGRLTIAMKNLMGIVWDRGYWHANDLHQCIADFATTKKTTLNIVDAYLVMKRNGPRGVSVDDVVEMKSLLISTDIVAIDTAAAKLFGMEPDKIRYILLANDYKIGTMDLDKLNIKRVSL